MNTIQEWLGNDNKLGQDIWEKKYQQHGETFDQWLDRVSGGDLIVRQMIERKQFLFGGRILSNRGLHTAGKKVTYSNCYVLEPPKDSIESIFETAGKLARTFSYGGGVGIDISKLAPRGAQVNNTAKETTGSVSFMELYNLVTGLIGQNGRRGALMLSLDVNHPDLEEFISIKNDLNTITKANISVRVDDAFMQAVISDINHTMTFVREETGEVITKVMPAKKIFRQLCENNWNFAEPGILYWDRINDWNILSNDDSFEYAGVNPCAEEPLPAGGSCLLGSINLSAFVHDGEFSFSELKDVVYYSVIALNDILDEGLGLHPLTEQQDSVRDWRQIGLGIFGLGDMLIKMGLPYDSDAALEFCESIASLITSEAIFSSCVLASERGHYPKFKLDKVLESAFIQEHTDDCLKTYISRHGLCNSQLLTIAPTGTLSTMLGITGGIEPMYDTHYTRKTESLHGEDVYYNVYTPIVEKYMKEHDMELEDLPSYFSTAKTIDPFKRVKMQAIWQTAIDASISSTINLPYETSVETIEELYMAAWTHGLKGLTIFRDNCARLGVLSSAEPAKEEVIAEPIFEPEGIVLDSVSPLSRADLGPVLNGSTYIKEMACGKMYITINRDADDNLVEVFIDSGKSGGCSANTECLGRYASACMRSGMKIEDIVDVTKGVKCSACSKFNGMGKKLDGISCGDIVAKTIKEEYDRFHTNTEAPKIQTPIVKPDIVTNKLICPECGNIIVNSGGCIICNNCGYSKCD